VWTWGFVPETFVCLFFHCCFFLIATAKPFTMSSCNNIGIQKNQPLLCLLECKFTSPQVLHLGLHKILGPKNVFPFAASIVLVLIVPRQNLLYRWLETSGFQFFVAILVIGVSGFGMGGSGKRMKEERSFIRCFLKNSLTEGRYLNIQLILHRGICADLY